MATARSTTKPLDAFKVYVEMGAKRSLIGTERILKSRGYKIARSTLIEWKNKFGWDETISADEAKAQQARELAAIGAASKEIVDEANKTEAFTPDETFQGSINSIQSMTAGLAAIVTRHVQEYVAANAKFDLPDVLRIAKMAGDLGNVVGALHKVTNPAPAKPTRDPETGILQGHAAPAFDGPPGLDEIMGILQNPPRTR